MIFNCAAKLLSRAVNTLSNPGVQKKVVSVHGWPVYLQTANRHELNYESYFAEGQNSPQVDVDLSIFRQFIPKGSTVLDAGANIGITALQMLDAGAGKVVALEPVPEIAKRLRRLYHPQIDAIETALGKDVGTVSLTLSTSHNQGATFKSDIIERFPSVFEGAETVSVSTTTIDTLAKRYGPFAFWKLDIEGAEIDALKGGASSLRQHPPVAIWAEIYGDDDVRQFVDILRSSHPVVHRVFVGKHASEVIMMPYATPDDEDLYARTSPMYLALS